MPLLIPEMNERKNISPIIIFSFFLEKNESYDSIQGFKPAPIETLGALSTRSYLIEAG